MIPFQTREHNQKQLFFSFFFLRTHQSRPCISSNSLLGVLSWSYFISVLQRRSFMWETSGVGVKARKSIKSCRMTSWLEWMRMFIRSNLFQNRRQNKKSFFASSTISGFQCESERWGHAALCWTVGKNTVYLVALPRHLIPKNIYLAN